MQHSRFNTASRYLSTHFVSSLLNPAASIHSPLGTDLQHRLPSDDSQAVSLSNPFCSSSQRGSLILWHLPSDGTAALAPARFNRSSVASTSGHSVMVSSSTPFPSSCPCEASSRMLTTVDNLNQRRMICTIRIVTKTTRRPFPGGA